MILLFKFKFRQYKTLVSVSDVEHGAGEVPGEPEGVPDDVPHGEGERDGGLAPALLPRAELGARPGRRRAARPQVLQRRDQAGPAAGRGRLDHQHRQLRYTARGQYHTGFILHLELAMIYYMFFST